MNSKIIQLLAFASLIGLTSCSAEYQEGRQTYHNREKINLNQPVPDLDYSQRRGVLSAFYVINGLRYMPTCTIITDGPHIAWFDSVGPAVNLSNQMTDKSISEPDSVYAGDNEQTMALSATNKGIISESHTTVITNTRCPEFDQKLSFGQVV
jgi:hypothetical protein